MLWIVYWILQGQAQNTLLHEVGFLHNPTKYLAFLCTLLVPVSAVLSSTYFHAWLPCFSRSLESDGMSPDVWSPFTTSSLSVGFQLHSLPCSWRLKLWKQVPKLASLVFSEVLPMEETGVRLEDGRRKENISVCSGVLEVAQGLTDMGSGPVQTAQFHGGSSDCSQSFSNTEFLCLDCLFCCPTQLLTRT